MDATADGSSIADGVATSAPPVPAGARSTIPARSSDPVTVPLSMVTVVRRASEAATIVAPSSVSSRWSTGWSTRPSSLGSRPVSTPPSPMAVRSTVAIRPSSYPTMSWFTFGSTVMAVEPGAAITPISARERRS